MSLDRKHAYLEHTSTDDHRILYAQETIQLQGITSMGYQHAKHLDEIIPLHYHPNRFEFHYLISGNLSFSVGEETYSLKGGDVFVTFPNELHQSGEQTVVRKMYWFSIEDGEELLGLPAPWSHLLMEGLRGLKNRVIPVGKEMRSLLQEVFLNLSSTEEEKQYYASAQMAAFLHRLIDYDRHLAPRLISKEIQTALDFIRQNCHRTILLEEVANHCHLSFSYFKHRFKSEIGITPSFYIQRERIHLAKDLLRQGHSIVDTAYRLDFSSSNYFSTVFRRITQMTPTEYLATLQEEPETE